MMVVVNLVKVIKSWCYFVCLFWVGIFFVNFFVVGVVVLVIVESCEWEECQVVVLIENYLWILEEVFVGFFSKIDIILFMVSDEIVW